MQASTKNKSGISSQLFSRNRKIMFNLILLIFPLIIFTVIELGLRAAHFGHDLSLFVKTDNYPGYFQINPDVNLRYFTKVGETSTTDDIFLIEKPDTCYRVFVLGSSTTRGFPYQASTSFPRILYYRLQDAIPHKRIEVVNLSASAINSYAFVDMIDEVLDHKPDLVLVYGGHNEYYGAMGVASVENGGNFRWMKKTRLKLTRFKTFQWLQSVIIKTGEKINSDKQKNSGTLMERIVKDKDIVFGSKLYTNGVKQFEANMDELIRKVKKQNVTLVLSELVSNVSDLPPFQSLKTDEFPAAVEIYNEAKTLEAEGNFEAAKIKYYKAKDLDVIRFRAPEAINEIIHQLAAQYKLPVVPMKDYFEKASPNGLIGNELILEHLHPTIDGYFLMADAFLHTLRNSGIISNNWDSGNILPSSYYRNRWGFTELDSLIGDLNIRSLMSGWPFNPESEPNLFIKSYRPTGYVDSMAFAYLTSTVRHIEDEHIKLALYYSQNGLNDKAFKEYFSLIKLHPYIGDLYYDASRYLIADHKYQEAFDLINSAPLMNHDYFYYYMQGTLKLKIDRVSEGIKDLEYAMTIQTEQDNPLKVLTPLYATYRENGDSVNKVRILKEIKKYNPNFIEPEPVNLKNNEQVIRISITEIYNRALVMIQKNENEKALELLLKTDKLKPESTIKKLIGMVYFMDKNYQKAYEYSGESFKMNPNDYDNLNNYYVLTLMKKDLKRAAELLQQMQNLKLSPEQIDRFNKLYEKRVKELETVPAK